MSDTPYFDEYMSRRENESRLNNSTDPRGNYVTFTLPSEYVIGNIGGEIINTTIRNDSYFSYMNSRRTDNQIIETLYERYREGKINVNNYTIQYSPDENKIILELTETY